MASMGPGMQRSGIRSTFLLSSDDTSVTSEGGEDETSTSTESGSENSGESSDSGGAAEGADESTTITTSDVTGETGTGESETDGSGSEETGSSGSTSETGDDATSSSSGGESSSDSGTTTADGTETGGEDTSGETGGLIVPTGTCLIAYEGGTPAAVATSIHVGSDGTLTQVDTIDLDGAHTPLATGGVEIEPGGITACGRRVYAVLDQAQKVAGIDVATDGMLSDSGNEWSVSTLRAIACDGTAGVLLAGSVESTSAVVRTAALDDDDGDGTLTEQDSEVLSIAGVDEDTDVELVTAAATGVAYVLVSGSDNDEELSQKATLNALTYDGGTLSVVDSLSIDDYTTGLAVDIGGTRLAISGYSGGCVAWIDPGMGGSLDTMLQAACGAWANGRAVTLATSDVLTLSNGTTTIRVGEVDGTMLTDLGTVTAAGKQPHVRFAHENGIMLVGDGESGTVASFTVSSDFMTITAADSLDIDAGTSFQASVLVSCDPPA